MGLDAIEHGILNEKSLSKADEDLNNIYIRIKHLSEIVKKERGIFSNVKIIEKIRRALQDLDNDFEIILNKLRAPKKENNDDKK
jgi:hypothetical protein